MLELIDTRTSRYKYGATLTSFANLAERILSQQSSEIALAS